MATRSAPQIIHIKRKRDSAPVDQLYLEADVGKRRRVHDSFVFKRVERLILPLPARPFPQFQSHAANGIPIVQSTAPGTELDDPFALQQHRAEAPSHHIVVESAAGARSGDDGPRKFELARDAEPDLMDIDVVEEGDYVYDVFVREALNKEGPVPVGVAARLVIGKDDQEWMENYFYSDDEEDDRVDTDDEDSNAEDYYGADYPEDEDDDFEGRPHEDGEPGYDYLE
jgi:hypothetical protein